MTFPLCLSTRHRVSLVFDVYRLLVVCLSAPHPDKTWWQRSLVGRVDATGSIRIFCYMLYGRCTLYSRGLGDLFDHLLDPNSRGLGANAHDAKLPRETTIVNE